jgi:hypothetical protein
MRIDEEIAAVAVLPRNDKQAYTANWISLATAFAGSPTSALALD